ncbi:MAG: LysE family translocator [Candidatus Dormibacteraeota bacterium]|nr:LysE family translocator [Candidatus Dormibacteraeota bacterium]
MPGTPALLTFAAISLLLAVTPGPDMAVVTKNALTHGRRGVLLTTTGIAFALLLWVSGTAVGVAALIRASGGLFVVLKIAGGLYLGYLGLRAWWDSRLPQPDMLAPGPASPAGSVLRQGFLSAATNPKLGVFFVTFLPQFVNPHGSLVAQLLLLGAIFALLGWLWLNVYGLAIARLRAIITAPPVRRWMERVTGSVLIGLGLRLVLERT